MAEDRPLYVARDEDLAVLNNLWNQAREGTPHVLRLQAPFGGGRRALAGRFLSGIDASTDDAVVWRVVCLDQENGLQWLVRMYGSLVASLTTDVLRRGRIEMILNGQLPTQPKRVQGWYQAFVGALKEAKTDREKGAVQLKMPQDNPLIGLVEIVSAIARKVPVVLDLQNANTVHSLALAQFVEALYTEAREHGGKLLVLLHDEPESDVTKAMYPMPLLDLFERRGGEFDVHAIAPWGEAETTRYLESKGLTDAAGGNAARLAEIARGRPGYIAELVEILEERGELGGDLSGTSFASLVPLTVDESELEVPEEPPAEGERQHAGKDDLPRVAFLAALLGQAFPSGLVADMGGFERDSVDDLIDAAEDLFEEVQFAQDLGTWIYKFKRGAWREGILEQNDSDEGHELARRVGVFMERFLVPRGYGFIAKTARVYAEHGAAGRANLMRSVALTNDAPDVWGLAYDLSKYFDEITWPDPLRRTVYMNLLDRLVGSGSIQTAERVHTEATEWATSQEDRELTAWLLFAGSRLDLRRQDLYRARDRARDAITIYEGLDNKTRVADIYNHLAGIEIQDGNPNAALENVTKALELGRVDTEDGKEGYVPGVLAQAEYIRGLVARRANDLQRASDHFRRANEVAGQAGLAPLALDAGLGYGEALLASGQIDQARPVLQRVVQIAQSLRNPMRERSACELAAQAEGAGRNFETALQLASRTLQLSQQMKFEQVLPIDLYNVGFFNYALKKPTEALAFFNQSAQRIGGMGNHPVVKELFYFKGLAHLQTGQINEARQSLQQAVKPAQQHKDWPKVVSSLENLAGIEQQQGNADNARKLLNDAINVAQQANLKEQRKQLRKKLEALA